MSKEAEIAKVLMPYLVLYPNNKINDETLKMYARVLSPLAVAEIDAAMRLLSMNSKFFPAVSEIVQAAKEVRKQVDGTTLPTAADAWGEVMQQARRNGMDRPWIFSCSEIKRTLKAFGGKSLICMMEEKDTPIIRAQFMKMYNEQIQRDEKTQEVNEMLDRLPAKEREAIAGKVIQLAEAKAMREAKA